MPYKPAKFLCSEYDPLPAQKAARRAHSGQMCTIVQANNNWTYRIRFADGVEVTAYENEVPNAKVESTFWGGRGGH